MSNPRTPAGGDAGVDESVTWAGRQAHDTATAGQSDIDGRVLTDPAPGEALPVRWIGGAWRGRCRFFPGEWCRVCAVGYDRFYEELVAVGGWSA